MATHATAVEGTDTAVRLPVVGGVTFNEAHSMLLGLVGVLAGVGFRLGYEMEVAAFTFAVVLVAFGMRRASGENVPAAQRVIRREPWYFLTVYIATAVAAGLAWPMVV